MKLNMKSIMTIAALLLLSASAWAQGQFTVDYKLNGNASTAGAAGTVVGSISGTTATLTVTPADGNYITAGDISVVKTVPGNVAQGRYRAPGVGSVVAVTATNASADPSGVTTYTFDASDANYNYEVTANFRPRTSVEGATVTVAGTCTYNGSAQKPNVTVVLGGVTLTKGTDYDVYYADSINAGTGKITIVGTRTYKGTKTGTQYTINKAASTLTAPTSKTLTYNASPQELVNAGTATGGTMEYSLDGTNYSTSIPTGTDAKTYSVYYRVTGDGNHNNVAAATVNVTIGQATITSVTIDQTQFVYDPSVVQVVNVTKVMAGTLVVPVGSYEIVGNSNKATAIGTHTVTIQAKAGTNNFKGSASTTFTITQRMVNIDFGGRTFRTFYDAYDTFLVPGDITAYIVTGVSDHAVIIKKVSYIKAGIPVLLESTPGTTNVEDPAESFDGNLLKYAAPSGTAGDKHYILYCDEFVRATGIINGKVFLDLEDAGAGARSYAINSDETTEIEENTAIVVKQIDGSEDDTTDPGEVTCSNGTITVTPSAGYYLTLADLTVVKALNGENAESRGRAPGIDIPVVLTATNPSADPSGETTYTFTVTDPIYDYVITANFHSRTSVGDAVVTVVGGPYTYDGTAHKPDVTVVVGDVTLTKGTDYDVYYTDSINAGTGKITIVGTRTYNGMQTGIQYAINKAKAKVQYGDKAITAKIGKSFTVPNVTLDPSNLPITYRSSDSDVATVDEQTGEVTLIAPGEVSIFAEFAGDTNYDAASDYYVLTVLQRDIEPIDEDVTITWRDEDFFFTNDEGELEEVKLINVVIFDVLFTLDISGDPSESDGYDETDHSVVLNHSVSNDLMNFIVTNGGDPGTDAYAEQYTGMTFKVPAGKGYVIIESKTDGEHVMMIKIGNLAPIGFNHTDIQKDNVFYECDKPTWVYVYNGGEVNGGNARMSVPRAKKTKTHIKIYSITRSSSSQSPNGIEFINSEDLNGSDVWYDLQGNKINRPTKKGIYIQQGQKVVVK